MTQVANNDNPVDQAEQVTETIREEEAEAATDAHKLYLVQSTMMLIDDLLAGRTRIDS